MKDMLGSQRGGWCGEIPGLRRGCSDLYSISQLLFSMHTSLPASLLHSGNT